MTGVPGTIRSEPLPVVTESRRTDAWWVEPLIVVAVLGSFGLYSLWVAVTNTNYFADPYLSFFWAPPACAVPDRATSYSGETRFPFIFQNVHRYFFWLSLVILAFLWW